MILLLIYNVLGILLMYSLVEIGGVVVEESFQLLTAVNIVKKILLYLNYDTVPTNGIQPYPAQNLELQ